MKRKLKTSCRIFSLFFFGILIASFLFCLIDAGIMYGVSSGTRYPFFENVAHWYRAWISFAGTVGFFLSLVTWFD